MGVGGEEIGRARADIGEIAAAAAGDEDLRARLGGVVDEQHSPPALAGGGGAEQPRRAGADDDRVVGLGGGHRAAPSHLAFSAEGGYTAPMTAMIAAAVYYYPDEVGRRLTRA